jgi:hypothetical protein
MPLTFRCRDQFLRHHINHRPCCKGQGIGQNRPHVKVNAAPITPAIGSTIPKTDRRKRPYPAASLPAAAALTLPDPQGSSGCRCPAPGQSQRQSRPFNPGLQPRQRPHPQPDPSGILCRVIAVISRTLRCQEDLNPLSFISVHTHMQVGQQFIDQEQKSPAQQETHHCREPDRYVRSCESSIAGASKEK